MPGTQGNFLQTVKVKRTGAAALVAPAATSAPKKQKQPEGCFCFVAMGNRA
jgi:hypothetical protein